MIVGHLALARIAKRTFFKTHHYAFLILASYGPDLVDKTGSMLIGYPGRNFGHSLPVFALVWGVAWLWCLALHSRQDVVLAGAVMWMSHLVGDFVRPTVLFWPFLGSITGDPFNLQGALYRMYVEFCWPGQLALEICAVTLALMPLPVLDRAAAWARGRFLRGRQSAQA